MFEAKTKALISFTVTAKLICVFVFAYAKRWFSYDAAQLCLTCVLSVLAYLLERSKTLRTPTSVPINR